MTYASNFGENLTIALSEDPTTQDLQRINSYIKTKKILFMQTFKYKMSQVIIKCQRCRIKAHRIKSFKKHMMVSTVIYTYKKITKYINYDYLVTKYIDKTD